MPFTLGFADNTRLVEHFVKHGSEVGAKTESDYEHLADSFLGGSKATGTFECLRSNGDLVRYNATTREFGILTANGYIRTYYPLYKRDSMAYFRKQCV